MERYLLNTTTNVICVAGDIAVTDYKKYTFVEVMAEEVEVEGGFAIIGTKENGEIVEAFLSEEAYFEGKEFRVGRKVPRKAEASIEVGTKVKVVAEVGYKGFEGVVVGEAFTSRTDGKKALIVEVEKVGRKYLEVEEVEIVAEEEEEVNLSQSVGKRLEAVKNLKLKRGDKVRIKFLNGQVIEVKVVRLGFVRRQAYNNRLEELFYLEDNNKDAWDLFNAHTIQVLERSTRSKKLLTEGMKQFNDALAFYLAQEKAREGYLKKKQEEKAKAEATREELAKKVEEAYYKKLKTNKEKVEAFAESNGLVVGCWNSLLEDFTEASLKHVLGSIDIGSATDILVRNNLQEYVVSVDFVDNEIDFTLWTKAEYISIFGVEKFLDY